MRFIKHLLAIATFIILGCVNASAQGTEADREVFDRVRAEVASVTDRPMSELVLAIAKAMQGTEYVASTLEVEPESLQISLTKTDCILFVETCIALAWTYKGIQIVQGGGHTQAEPSFELFCSNIQQMRYRNGVVDGYPSRLHYTSEWIAQNERNGVMKEMSGEMGEQKSQSFSFMSTHPESYRQLKNNPEFRKRIAETEKRLNESGPYHFISHAGLLNPDVMSSIKDGDIVAFVTTVAGLDISHVAIACTVNGEMHFIHASSKGKKVMIEPTSLADYAKNGIRLMRLL